jgi:hypothetical protein
MIQGEERETMLSFKGAHFPQEIILMGVRWYLAYPLSYRHVEELMEERGVPIDHATIQRWVVKYSPQLEEAFHRRKRPVWVSWRMDETYIRVAQFITICSASNLAEALSMSSPFQSPLRAQRRASLMATHSSGPHLRPPTNSEKLSDHFSSSISVWGS